MSLVHLLIYGKHQIGWQRSQILQQNRYLKKKTILKSTGHKETSKGMLLAYWDINLANSINVMKKFQLF